MGTSSKSIGKMSEQLAYAAPFLRIHCRSRVFGEGKRHCRSVGLYFPQRLWRVIAGCTSSSILPTTAFWVGGPANMKYHSQYQGEWYIRYAATEPEQRGGKLCRPVSRLARPSRSGVNSKGEAELVGLQKGWGRGSGRRMERCKHASERHVLWANNAIHGTLLRHATSPSSPSSPSNPARFTERLGSKAASLPA